MLGRRELSWFPSTMSRRQWTILVLWFAAVSHTIGQTSNVTQCVPPFAWSLNSIGQTPCFIAANLESLCGTPTSVNSIPPNNHYLAPTFATADPCQCNSVTYSLISACGGCQNRTFLDWPSWTANCISTTLTTFPKPIPSSFMVPQWAFLNVTLTNNTFSALAAQQNLSDTPVPTSTSSTTPSTSSSTSVSTSSSTPSTSASAGKSQSNAGAIAGGVVGGVVFLAVIGLALLWFILRRRRNMIQKDISFDNGALFSNRQDMSQSTTLMNGPSPLPSQSVYTSDMSTFPGSPLTTSGVYTTIPPSRRSLESVSLSVAQFGGGPQSHGVGQPPRGYAGAPEI